MKHKLSLALLSLAALPLAAQQTSGTIGSYELSPAAGTVEELQSVKITFQDLGVWWLATPDCSNVTLTSGSGTVYKVEKTEGQMENYCTMYFGSGSEAEAITAPGTYKLSIPQGVFKQDFSDDKFNDLIEAEYVIESVEPNTLDSYSLTPAAGSVVTSLETVNISFAEAASTGVDAPADLSQITLEYDGTTYICIAAETDGNAGFNLKFGTTAQGEPLTFKRPGDYKLFIPKKVFTATGTEEQNNYKVEATYTVDNPDFDPMVPVVCEPVQDSYVPEFKTVRFTFPEATKGLDYPSDISGISLSINDEPTTYVATNASMADPYDNVSLSFASEQYGEPMTFTTEGKYTITVPAGTFKESGSDLYKNHDITLCFNVGEEPAPNPFDEYTCTPADNETVGEIHFISIKFPQLAENGIKWPYDITKVTLQREGDETVYVGNTATLSAGNAATTGFSTADEQYSNPLHFRTPGVYTITVPAGTFASEADPAVANNEIVLHYTVDASYNFTYKLTPDPEKVVSSLSRITIDPVDVLTSINVAENSSAQATLECGEQKIALAATFTENGAMFTTDKVVKPGICTLTIPAGLLTAATTDRLEIVNAQPITAVYTVKEPQHFSYNTTPTQDETIALFTKFSVAIESAAQKVGINTTAGEPSLSGADKQYKLNAALSAKEVIFAIEGGAALADGEYTVIIPAGYIVTTDADGLEAALPEITRKFKIRHPEKSDYAKGMLLYNEGWYGHDMASFTHIDDNGNATYNAFMAENPERSLGLTGTWASDFAGKIYAISKQAGKNINGVEGGILTQIDGASLAYIGQITSTPEGNKGHAFCGVNENKGYLSTSTGIYPVNLSTMTLGDRIAATETVELQYGEMLRYRGRVFAAVQNWDPIVIDPATDSFTELATGPIVTSFVTNDGTLYMATMEEGREFVKVDPATLTFNYVSLDGGDFTGRMRVAKPWSTWRPAPLAVDKNENVVYYATDYDVTTIARADLATGEFTPDFIALPSTDGGQQCIYGQGISVDPATGEIVITAVEEGYGTHYKQNYVYRVDSATGKIIDDKTLKLSEYYWFPSMAVYCGFEAPELNFENVSLTDGDVTINMHEHTSLALGNKYMIEYNVTSSNPQVCSVEQTGAADYLLSKTGDGTATITVKADFQGLTSTEEFTVGTSSISTAAATAARCDVYTPTGILVLKDADAAAIRILPAGIYIAGGKKIIVR